MLNRIVNMFFTNRTLFSFRKSIKINIHSWKNINSFPESELICHRQIGLLSWKELIEKTHTDWEIFFSYYCFIFLRHWTKLIFALREVEVIKLSCSHSRNMFLSCSHSRNMFLSCSHNINMFLGQEYMKKMVYIYRRFYL